MLLEMEGSVLWIMEVFTSEDLCDEVEEAIKRIMNQPFSVHYYWKKNF